MAEWLRLAVADVVVPLAVGGQGVRVTVSLGVAEASPAMADGRELFAAADAALYAAKAAGKNRVVLAGAETA